MKRRAALYLRVSGDDQTTENQRPDVNRVVRTRGFKVVAVYEEQISTKKQRPKFDAMMGAAHRGMFDVVVIWSLDRLGRSMVGNLQAVLALDACNVQVISVREPWLDTGGAVRPLLIAIFGWVAEQERTQVVERTKAGLARARRRGIRLGRPETRIDLPLARSMKAEGLSIREIAKRLKVPATTLHRATAGRTQSRADRDGAV